MKKILEKVSERKRQTRTIESWMILNGKKGDHFYSDKEDKYLTAIASYYKRKVTTERLICVRTIKNGRKIEAYYITKVTLH